VLSVCLTPDGQWVMSGSKDRGVQFWDPVTGNAQMMLQGHKNSGKTQPIPGGRTDQLANSPRNSYLGRPGAHRQSFRNRQWRHACTDLEVRLDFPLLLTGN
jgi:WD40 repeat protein